MAITDKKVSETYAGRDIASLSDRPNEDGLTATQLKARFDQLGKEVIPNYNDLIDELDQSVLPSKQPTLVSGSNIKTVNGTSLLGSGDIVADKSYHHEQAVPSATWVITHNLGKYPTVVVINGFNQEVIGDVTYNSSNQLTITFSGSFSGDAYLN